MFFPYLVSIILLAILAWATSFGVKRNINRDSMLLLVASLSVLSFWAAIYFPFSDYALPLMEQRDYATGEHIDVSFTWLLRYLAETFGWFLGLVTFISVLLYHKIRLQKKNA